LRRLNAWPVSVLPSSVNLPLLLRQGRHFAKKKIKKKKKQKKKKKMKNKKKTEGARKPERRKQK